MPAQLLAAYALSVMVGVAAPPKIVKLSWVTESETEMNARYEAFSKDLVTVTLDPAEEPIYPGPYGRVATTRLLLAIAWHESGFMRDADVGPCDQKGARCDHGRSFCAAQIQVGTGKTAEGWSGPDLFHDRTKCFRAALHLVRKSFYACQTQPEVYKLAAYASGMCDRLTGQARSREIMVLYSRIRTRFVAPGPDAFFMQDAA
jgi:hypothetical protein